jgi:hypothetical protein
MNRAKLLERKNLDNVLTSASLLGTIEQYIKILHDGPPEFKLVCPDGNEYLIIPTSSLKESLQQYSGKKVKVFGMLNRSNNTLLLQKIFIKDLNEDQNNMIDLQVYKRRQLLKKIARTVNELVIIPIAVLAVLAA